MPMTKAWFLGEGSLLTQAAEIWRSAGHEVVGIASHEQHVIEWAALNGLTVVGSDELERAASLAPFDYLFSVVNLSMLPAAVLELPARMAVNFHDGPLPRYAGVNATVWALLGGEPVHGVSWHRMTAVADEGDVLLQRTFEVAPDETVFGLNAKCFTAGIETFRELCDHITRGTLSPTPQDFSQRSYFDFYARPPRAMVLDFREPPVELERLVRALDHGVYPNPVGSPKLLTANGPLLVSKLRILESHSGAAPGKVLATSDQAISVSGTTHDLELSGLKTLAGEVVDAAVLLRYGVSEGVLLPALDEASAAWVTESNAQAARSEGYFVRRLLAARPLSFPFTAPEAPQSPERVECSVPQAARVPGSRLPALVLAFAARFCGIPSFDVAYADASIRQKGALLPGVFASEVPLALSLTLESSLGDAESVVERARLKLAERWPHATDLFVRQPSLPREPLPVEFLVDVPPSHELPPGQLRILIDTQAARVTLQGRSDRVSKAELGNLAQRLGMFLEASASDENQCLGRMPLVSAEEQQRVLCEWNATESEVSPNGCVHALFATQAARTPEKPAVTAGGRTLSFAELERRANALAHELTKLGVGPDTLVGICLSRSVDLPVAVLGIHKAGGAYVPLDPAYPAERLRFMVADAALRFVVTERAQQAALPDGSFARVLIDSGVCDAGADAPPATAVGLSNLAYVIYTSGSTGTPKGVMVEHRNVANFFVGMDQVLRPEHPGTWLAVTSLSFDISVLEILWTLTRGFHVVVHAGETAERSAPVRRLDFSAFYFSSNDSGGGPEHYRLLFEGARFADENGFIAVWTPERHFHAFGGLYPNPSVISAALAVKTQRVALRAGSCVSPLHSPIRIAEEWSLVDNLSSGRVGISFASGWQPNDFAIRPDAFRDRKDQMFADIDVVRRLWRGERVQFKGGIGKDVGVTTLPRPVQKELPIWVTAAGNPETFEAAGRVGANLLTHLLGQTFEEVAEKVAVYRAAWEKAGHAGRGVVTIMLHTFVGTDADEVKETVRAPMKEYLRSAVGLVKQAAWSFPTFKQKFEGDDFAPEKLSAEEMDALLDYSFERYYSMSGLFGTVDQAVAIAQKVREVDVDEIACLIDFGVETERVLQHLPYVAKVLERVNTGVAATPAHAPAETSAPRPRETVGQLLRKYAITHFQCTPSMASLLLADPEARAGFGQLSVLLIGGEAFPQTLANELKGLTQGRIINVYGPTETTVWSSTHELRRDTDEIPIGRPIANTQILILDSLGNLAPPGREGELCIGGHGVVRGYLGRDELTHERFMAHPFKSGERLYRTGDLACFDDRGVLHFLGRLDHQVKVRGYRIELGEVETCLSKHAQVKQCVVLAREDTPGDKRLVAYVIAAGSEPAPQDLRAHVLSSLPEYMVPTNFVFLRSFPQTPNKKIDRKALPAPERQAAKAPAADQALPGNALEETIAAIWRDVLNTPTVGVNDNFFDVGGHSLLTIQVLGKLKAKVERPVTLIDLFGHPTIRGLATFLAAEEDDQGLDESAARGARRRAMRTRRR